MNEFIQMVNIQAVLLIYLLIGVFVKKMKIMNDITRDGLTDLLVTILLPCMIFESFNQSISKEQFKDAIVVLIVSLCICVFSIFLGKIIWRKFPQNKKSVLQYGTLISNSGFAGIPMIATAYGELGLFYASVFVIPNRVFMWSAGLSFFTEEKFKKRVLKVITNPGIIAVYLGLIRLFIGFPLPSFVDTALKNVGSTTTSISMIIIGSILANVNIKTIFEKSVFALAFVRLLFIPFMVIFLLRFISIDEVAGKTAVLLTAMPVGTTTAILAQKYGADGVFGSKCVFVTTVLSLFTVPLITLFLNR